MAWRIHDADTRKPLTTSVMHQPGRVLHRLYQLIGEWPKKDYYIADRDGTPISARRFAVEAKYRPVA